MSDWIFLSGTLKNLLLFLDVLNFHYSVFQSGIVLIYPVCHYTFFNPGPYIVFNSENFKSLSFPKCLPSIYSFIHYKIHTLTYVDISISICSVFTTYLSFFPPLYVFLMPLGICFYLILAKWPRSTFGDLFSVWLW